MMGRFRRAPGCSATAAAVLKRAKAGNWPARYPQCLPMIRHIVASIGAGKGDGTAVWALRDASLDAGEAGRRPPWPLRNWRPTRTASTELSGGWIRSTRRSTPGLTGCATTWRRGLPKWMPDLSNSAATWMPDSPNWPDASTEPIDDGNAYRARAWCSWPTCFPATELDRAHRRRISLRPDGRTAAVAGFDPGMEESPGSTGIRCRLTAGGGDPRESATENKPPATGIGRGQG